MATGKVYITVVDVGQGQCTFVEIYNTAATPKLIHALLFDCGTDQSSTATQKNLEYIVTKVSGMTPPAFDCIVFSHSDDDHISLMIDLLKKFPTAKKPTVKQVWYGGYYDQYEKRKVNVLDYLLDNGYCASRDDIKTTGADYSGYDPDSKSYNEYLWKSDDNKVYLYSLVSNIMSSKPDFEEHDDVPELSSSIAKNRVSIIAGLYYAGASYVICGDAINATMAAVNKRMNKAPVFNNNIMTTLPHHGSSTTGFATASRNAIAVVETFAGLVNSKTISVSAFALHSHPSLELINIFIPTLTAPALRDARLSGANRHYITANLDVDLEMSPPPPKKGSNKRPRGYDIDRDMDTSFEIRENTFTTFYYNSDETSYNYSLDSSVVDTAGGRKTGAGAINKFASWKYTTAANGTFTVSGYSDLSKALPFTSASTASAAGELSITGEKKSSVSVRLKLPAANILASVQPVFNNRLKSFR